MPRPLIDAADLRGLARLTTEGVIGLAGLVEAMHSRIASPPRLPVSLGGTAPKERTRGITGLVYLSVSGITQVVGGSVDALLGVLEPRLARADPHQPDRAARQAMLAALNGVRGDHLAATRNPLAIRMAFQQAGRPLVLEKAALRARLPQASPKLLVLIHGLCMNPHQWRRDGHDHGEALARDLGYTPVYLHYNSGLSIATNGRLLAIQLQRLFDAWPVPIERGVLLGHSMGGLVARSALHHGAPSQVDEQAGSHGSARVHDLVCLGSPHLGAPLERAGHGIDRVLGAAPYAAPLARLGKIRSAGIRDLRLGHITDPPLANRHDPRQEEASLEKALRTYAVAGCLGASPHDLKSRALGDGLVPVDSALGRPAGPERRSPFTPEHQAVVQDTGHLDLLSSQKVYALLSGWLS